MTNTEWLRARLLAGVDTSAVGDKTEDLESLYLSEWSLEFEQLMRNRLLMGRYRYGRIGRIHDTNYDRIGSALQRLQNYQRTGNLEYLVDIANLCLMEFEHSDHPDKHFEAVDDGEHVGRK